MVQPVLDERQAADQLKDQMQCLKCDKEFGKYHAKRHVRKASFSKEADFYSTTPEKGMLS